MSTATLKYLGERSSTRGEGMHAFMNTAHGLLTNECTDALSMNILPQ